MKYSPRTLLRHLLVAILLFSLLITLFGADRVFNWIQLHRSFLLLWLSSSVFTAVFVDFLFQRNRLPLLLFDMLTDFTAGNRFSIYRKFKKQKLPAMTTLLLTWGSCQRCVAWWSGAVVSASIAAIYWKTWLAMIYFLLLGAATSAFISLTLFYFRSRRLRHQK